MTTSWARSRAFSLVMMRLTWVLAVSGDRNSRPAISSLDRPSATSASTSRSRSDRLQQVGGLGVLDQEAAGPGADRLIDVLVGLEGGQDDHLDPGQVVVGGD